MSSVKRSRRLAGWSGFAIRMGVVVVIGLTTGIGANVFGAWPGPLGLGLTLACNLITMVGALLVSLWWWRDIDEAAREAHKWAWWWGGCSGMALGMVVLLTVMTRSRVEPLPADDPSALFVGGMTILLVFQLIGYGVGWAVWWLKHR